MKRRPQKTFKLLLFVLVGGAIINVAVAWGCARVGGVPRPTFDNLGVDIRFDSHQQSFWLAIAPQAFPAPVFVRAHDLHGKRYLIAGASTAEEDYKNRYSFVLWILQVGWPSKAFGAESWYEVHGIQISPIQYSNWTFGNLRLPSRILWPGFAINTIFYAVILYALFAIPGAVRRRVRIKRGQCAACGYSLRENFSEKCPECGATK